MTGAPERRQGRRSSRGAGRAATGLPHRRSARQALDSFLRALTAYRDGGRCDEQMSIAARDLTDEQIRALAAHYSAIELEAVRIPGRD